MSFIEIKQSSKIYGSGDQEVRANDQISFQVQEGELTIIVGASGAGKSTLLNILGGMDQPTSGDIIINGKNIAKYSNRQLIKYSASLFHTILSTVQSSKNYGGICSRYLGGDFLINICRTTSSNL